MFNPNLLSKEDWIKIGVSEKTASAIEKYRSKGGMFHTGTDLLRIYHFDSALYNQISGYLIFPAKPVKQNEIKKKYVEFKKEIYKMELNSSDTSELEKLPGIGKILANRIIKYRSILGGFYQIEQLTEIYGLTTETFTKVNSKIVLDTTLIKKLSISKSSLEQFRLHPYIGKYKASLIIKYRNFNKQIKNINELTINGILNFEEFKKIKPYLEL